MKLLRRLKLVRLNLDSCYFVSKVTLDSFSFIERLFVFLGIEFLRI